jgi:hypothetical protein
MEYQLLSGFLGSYTRLFHREFDSDELAIQHVESALSGLVGDGILQLSRYDVQDQMVVIAMWAIQKGFKRVF